MSSIQACADQQEGDGGPHFDLHLSDLQGSKRASRVLAQVAREAIVNASKYSNASRIRVELLERPVSFAELCIEDDGDGFDPSAVDTRAHFGLALMRDRVEATGGTLTISSVLGVGTRITAVVSLADTESTTS